jgi:tetratricopeptide (TPR) repeat protein
MNKIALLFLPMLFCCSALFAQHYSIDEYIDKGTALHDKQKYFEALELYRQALDIDSTSPRANYEMANTYVALEKYERAIYFADKVIAKNTLFVDHAYTIKGTALDLLGKYEDALDVYNKGVKKYPENYLLNYNLALTYYNAKDYVDARIYATNAIGANNSRASSHLLLAQCMYHADKRTQTLQSLYYFLLLEPNSKRSESALALMAKLSGAGVKKEGENQITINISKGSTDDEFADLSLSMMQALKISDTAKVKNEEETFYKDTKSFFSILSELKKKKSPKNIWWDFYTPFFKDLVESGNAEAFCYYIAQSRDKEAITGWLKGHQDKVERLIKWYNDYNK